VTYGNRADCSYGTITTFDVTIGNGGPIKIQLKAAMEYVPKFILQKFGDGMMINRTTLFMPQNRVWETTTQQTTSGTLFEILSRLFSRGRKPDVEQNEVPGEPEIGQPLKTALSIGGTSFRKFYATVPQMIAMLHHKAGLIENIRSEPVSFEPSGGKRVVKMVLGPEQSGHHTISPPHIIVFAPCEGEWIDERLSWK